MAADRADKRGVDRIGSGHLPCSARSIADENSANDSNASIAISTRTDIRDVPTRDSKVRYQRSSGAVIGAVRRQSQYEHRRHAR